MSSPITGSDFTIVSGGQSFCDRITNLLSLSSKMKVFFDWAFPAGLASNSFKAMFLPPEGVILPYYTSSSEAEAKLKIEALNRDTGDAGIPFWRLCDGTNGTPDLRGRVLMGCGQNSDSSLTSRGGAGTTGGDESTKLTEAHIPQHKHQLKTPNNKGIPCWNSFTQEAGGDYNSSVAFSGATGTLDADPANNVLGYSTPIMTESYGTETTSQQSVPTIPPYYGIYYMIRTARTE